MKVTLIFATLLFAGCQQPTSFKGDAHFPGGPSACYEMCKSNGMEIDSYIFVGEYSSGCVCRPRMAGHGTAQSSAGSTAAAAGVIAQTRIEEERRQKAAAQQKSQQ